MKITLALLLAGSVIVLMAWTTPLAASSKSVQEEEKHEESEHEHGEDHEMLEKQMKILKKATRRLKKKFRKKSTQAADVLKDIKRCQGALFLAKDIYPGELKGKKNASNRVVYSSIMIDCLVASLKAEKSALAGDLKQTAIAFKTMLAAQKKGHDKFRDEDD